MCGIWALFGASEEQIENCSVCYTAIHHRGPDAWRVENDAQFKNCCLGFHRLAINDTEYGMQPLKLRKYPHLWLLCNGEIYNFRRLEKEFGFKYETDCDVECILHLYAEGRGIDYCAAHLDGVFSFCLVDADQRKVFIARDTFGVRPSFTLKDKRGFMAVSSEAKGLIGLSKGLINGNASIRPVLPAHCEEYDLSADGRATFVESRRFHVIGSVPKYQLAVSEKALDPKDVYANVRNLFIAAVEKRLMAERRIGCLLSGGLDSSLAAAVLLKLSREKNFPYAVQTFAVGLCDSPDVIAARKVAKFIGSEHYEFIVSPEEILEVLDRVIYHLESYDITTIRASVCMYLLSQHIRDATDTTVIFSGEGADEVAQGYIYFRDAPTGDDADCESRRLLQDLYLYDGLRGDRTTAAYGLELRVPFLDHQFTGYYLSLPKSLRQPKDGIEKFLLRRAFDGTDLLPNDILWRHKEAFSDGVASRKKSLYVILQEFAETRVTDEELATASTRYPHNTPKTKESLYYRRIFESLFPGQQHLTPYMWMPKWTDAKDPSARFLTHYAADTNGVDHY